MKITENKDHVLFENELGSYHLSLDEYDLLGEVESKNKAEREIYKKHKSDYKLNTINFKKARELGFCEYGIKDFCEMLGLDIDKEYSLDELNKLLTIDVLEKYPDECIKLFGSDTLKYLGGVKGVLSEDTIYLVLRSEFIPEKKLHELSVKFAYSFLDNFEKFYPNDDRPRKAIEVKEAWIRGDISDKELESARSAARSAESAARSAAWPAARSAWSAARSAAWSAARSAESARSASSAAWSTAWSTGSAASSAAKKEQVKMILEVLNEN